MMIGIGWLRKPRKQGSDNRTSGNNQSSITDGDESTVVSSRMIMSTRSSERRKVGKEPQRMIDPKRAENSIGASKAMRGAEQY